MVQQFYRVYEKEFGGGIGEWRLEAAHVLDLLDFLQVVTDVLKVFGVVHPESELGGEQPVAGVDMHAVDVHVELLREDARVPFSCLQRFRSLRLKWCA